VLGASGYVEGAATQAPEVATGVRLLLGAVPVALAALAFACFWLYPLRGRGDGDGEVPVAEAVADAAASPTASDPLPR
jgi:GPH family glycoside/pentoside/hexuronide:cation symporter